MFLSFPALLLALSVLASLIFTITTTENLAKIPFRLVFRRALGGMVIFLFFWGTLCILLNQGLVYIFPSLTSSPTLRYCLSILIGLLVPQSGKLKDAFLPRRFAKNFRLFQEIDEQTRLYLGKIIDREERKISSLFFTEDTERRLHALDRVFEERNIEIAREEAKRHRHQPLQALDVFKVRTRSIKFKYLLRYLGYSDCLYALKAAAANPGMVLPTWPIDFGDRRLGSVNDTVGGHQLRRRKYEQPEVQAYVLDIAGIQLKKKHQVFVSSTYLDLKEERQRVLKTLLCSECIPAGMEFFPSSDEELWDLISGYVDECDYYILLIGGRYGSITREGISYTEAEYDYATKSGKPVLPFIQASPPPSAEGLEAQGKLRAFREKVGRMHAPAYWSSVDEIPLLVSQAIEKCKKERPATGWIRPTLEAPRVREAR